MRCPPAGKSFTRTVKELQVHCERASPALWKSFLNSEIFNLNHLFLVHLFLFITKNVYLLFETISTSVSCIEIRFYLSVLLVALWQCGFSEHLLASLHSILQQTKYFFAWASLAIYSACKNNPGHQIWHWKTNYFQWYTQYRKSDYFAVFHSNLLFFIREPLLNLFRMSN